MTEDEAKIKLKRRKGEIARLSYLKKNDGQIKYFSPKYNELDLKYINFIKLLKQQKQEREEEQKKRETLINNEISDDETIKNTSSESSDNDTISANSDDEIEIKKKQLQNDFFKLII
jgi:hypothetical protein